MTTKVIIMNEGPDDIKIEIKGRDAEGRFTEGREMVITKGTFVAEYVHDSQSLQIFEHKFLETQYE